jgi:membrane carboxypeptidase/penicillin-binding protein
LFYFRNAFLKNTLIKGLVILGIGFVISIVMGIMLGQINNMKSIEELLEVKRPSQKSTLLDRNNEVVTEFYSDEKRDNINLEIGRAHV